MSNYPNWFAMGAQWYFEKHLPAFEDKKVSFLQIGAYTGDASKWMLENVLTHEQSTLTDVDTWEGSDEAIHKSFDWSSVEDTYNDKVGLYISNEKLIKFKGTSNDFFYASGFLHRKYDFIYVDGDHTAAGVLQDGINALECSADGGIVAFDDYTWRSGKGPTFDPAPAIDALMIAYADRFEVIDKGTQVWLRRK